MSREVTSEQLSGRERVGYDEVFPLGHEPEEGFCWSSERETLAQSSNEEVESRGGEDDVVSGAEDEDDKGEGGRENDEDENIGEEEVLESNLGSPGDDHPFCPPKKWMVNNFLLTMSDKVFKTSCGRYQILDNILIHLPRKFERCYSGKTANFGMYDAMFVAGLRLPLTAFHCQLASFLGLSISQIAPNAWRIFIEAEIL